MQYVIFDDHKINNFYPITLNRSIGDLRLGILKLRQRIAAYLNIQQYTIVVPELIFPIYAERHPDLNINNLEAGEYIFINSRLKVTEDWVNKIQELPVGNMLSSDDTVIAAHLNINSKTTVSSDSISDIFSKLKIIETEKSDCWEYLWQLISSNAKYIESDFQDFFYDEDNHYEVELGVTTLNPYNIWIGEGVVLQPGVVIDASEGPVVLDEGCKVMVNSLIQGPAYVGKKSIIKACSRIYEGTSIGPVCKVGGEVEATIFQGYSNKQHDGFLGHSYLGEWVNLGANTNNSDLKNNYKAVSVYVYSQQSKVNTECLFVGAVIGDHTKTAISTTINTGTVIGIGCNLYGKETFKDNIPCFSWGESNSLQQYRLESFLDTSDTVKKRRGLILSENEQKLYKQIFEKRL